MKTIAFDCDGTLQDGHDNPRLEVIDMLNEYRQKGWRVIVWSGGGKEYASAVVRRLRITNVECLSKFGLDFRPDIAVDDQPVSLGVKNIQV